MTGVDCQNPSLGQEMLFDNKQETGFTLKSIKIPWVNGWVRNGISETSGTPTPRIWVVWLEKCISKSLGGTLWDSH